MQVGNIGLFANTKYSGKK